MKIKYHRCDENVLAVELQLYPETSAYEVFLEGTEDVTLEVLPHTAPDHNTPSRIISLDYAPLEGGTISFTGGKAVPVKFIGFHDKLKMTSSAPFSYSITGGN